MFSIFKKRKAQTPRQSHYPMPSWEKIVSLMQGKQLHCFVEDVVDVIYSQDRDLRLVLLKNKQDLYHYIFEQIQPYDQEEWDFYRSMNPEALPAMWMCVEHTDMVSYFASEEDAARELVNEPLFRQYFM